jgi:hypothetical protein
LFKNLEFQYVILLFITIVKGGFIEAAIHRPFLEAAGSRATPTNNVICKSG